MPLRQLTEIERQRLERLTAEAIDVTLLQPTRTGLEKAILDATAPVRNYLIENGIHDYLGQRQGTAHRVHIDAQLLGVDHVTASRASLYRPETKSGDPRIWFKGLPEYARPDDMIAITVHSGRLLLINLTQIDVGQVLDNRREGPLWEALHAISGAAKEISDELLARLRVIAARGLLASVMDDRADTAIGRTLEAALGIEMNANRAPDYRGIELKSYRRATRASQENRKTLFARVPNWEISKFKSSAQILDTFGYQREADFKLYCTTSARRPNAQGLFFRLSAKENQLDECSIDPEIGAFASWLMADLRQALVEKHNETFWIGGTSHIVEGHEYFHFLDVLHTRKPILSQFDILLEQGEITMDHLIKRNAKGRVSEKGPLFKINTTAMRLLFPPSQRYELH